MVPFPTFHVPSLKGASSDASGSTEKGWVSHAFGAFAHDLWSPKTRRLLQRFQSSINALELLAAAAAVQLAESSGKTPNDNLFVLKCDNRAACATSNYGIAVTEATIEAMRTWHDASACSGITAHLLYTDTKSKIIADTLSRAYLRRALEE